MLSQMNESVPRTSVDARSTNFVYDALGRLPKI